MKQQTLTGFERYVMVITSRGLVPGDSQKPPSQRREKRFSRPRSTATKSIVTASTSVKNAEIGPASNFSLVRAVVLMAVELRVIPFWRSAPAVIERR